jgi:cysteine desulfurase
MESTYADLLSLDVGKCNGPKGVGMLVRSRRATVAPALFGGGQESGLRPGTENTAGVVGASVALELAQKDFKNRAEKVAKVRDAGIEHLLAEIPSAILNGPTGAERLANNINISIPELDTEFATVVLDKHGFAVSTKSACAGAGGGESKVVATISGDPARATSTLRISLSPETTFQNLRDLANVLKTHIEKMSKY